MVKLNFHTLSRRCYSIAGTKRNRHRSHTDVNMKARKKAYRRTIEWKKKKKEMQTLCELFIDRPGVKNEAKLCVNNKRQRKNNRQNAHALFSLHAEYLIRKQIRAIAKFCYGFWCFIWYAQANKNCGWSLSSLMAYASERHNTVVVAFYILKM